MCLKTNKQIAMGVDLNCLEILSLWDWRFAFRRSNLLASFGHMILKLYKQLKKLNQTFSLRFEDKTASKYYEMDKINRENMQNERRWRILERCEQERQELRLPNLFIDMKMDEKNPAGLNELIKQAQSVQFAFAAEKTTRKAKDHVLSTKNEKYKQSI